MKLRRGWIWYVAGLLLAVLAGVIAVMALRQAVPAAEPARPASRPVIVAARDISARQIVPLSAVEARELPLEEIPSGAIFNVEDAAGMFALADVRAGQPLLAQNLVAPPTGASGSITSTVTLAALLPADRVGVALAADDLLSKSGDVGIGDRIDVLASLNVIGTEEGEGGLVSIMSLQNVPVVKRIEEQVQSSVSGQPPERKLLGLIVAVEPQDAVTLKYFVDSGARVSITVRPLSLTTIFDVVPVTINYIADRFRIQVPQPVK